MGELAENVDLVPKIEDEKCLHEDLENDEGTDKYLEFQKWSIKNGIYAPKICYPYIYGES